MPLLSLSLALGASLAATAALGQQREASIQGEKAPDAKMQVEIQTSKFPDPSLELPPEDDSASSGEGKSKLEAIITRTSTSAWQRLNSLGNDSYFQGYFEEAQKNYLAAIRELKKTNIKDDRLMKSRNNLGSAYLRDGKTLDAKEAFDLALVTGKEINRDKSVEAARSLTGLAMVNRLNDNFKKSEQLYKDSLKMRQSIEGDSTQGVAQALLDLGELYRQQKLFAEAQPVYELALETLNKVKNVPELTKAYFLDRTAMLFQEQGKMPEAKKCFEMALQMKDKYSTLYSPVDPRKRGLVYYRCMNGSPNSVRVFSRGIEMEALHVKDSMSVATLTAQIYGADWYLLKAEVTIQNQGKTAISALPEEPTLALELPKKKSFHPLDSSAIAAELGARGRSLYNRLLHSADFAYVVDNITVGGATTTALTPFGANVFNTVGGWTTVRPDWEARAAARNAAMSALASSQVEANSVLRTKPAATTIGPGESATFVMFFPYNKFDACTLRILLGNTVLEFPFTYKSG